MPPASQARHPAQPKMATLEQPLQRVEQRLLELGLALRQRDAAAVDHFAQAAKQGGVPQALRHRLAMAGGQVAAQREALARATASLDRAIDVLIPGAAADPHQAPLYGAGGSTARNASRGGLLA